ncbi:hypothetical protein F5H01DRAFT_351776 [Linnemannia elongata]|nr:hypothetical protein F5H01DRAFT_351776 [Linnemannia elongata]
MNNALQWCLFSLLLFCTVPCGIPPLLLTFSIFIQAITCTSSRQSIPPGPSLFLLSNPFFSSCCSFASSGKVLDLSLASITSWSFTRRAFPDEFDLLCLCCLSRTL